LILKENNKTGITCCNQIKTVYCLLFYFDSLINKLLSINVLYYTGGIFVFGFFTKF